MPGESLNIGHDRYRSPSVRLWIAFFAALILLCSFYFSRLDSTTTSVNDGLHDLSLAEPDEVGKRADDPHTCGPCSNVSYCGPNSDGEDDGSIELMTDFYSDDTSKCPWNRKRDCCCNPSNKSSFQTVPLEDLLPAVPPSSNQVKFDPRFPNGGSSNPVDESAIGIVRIDGDPQAVTSVNKQDNSDLGFLDCCKVEGHRQQTVRFVCLYDGSWTRL